MSAESAFIAGDAGPNDALGRRKDVVYGGDAFAAAHLDLWGYNARNELTSSYRHASTTPDNPGAETQALRRLYQYDPIGNREEFTEGAGAALYYCTNSLNQYTATDGDSGCPSPGEQFDYDADGN